MSDQVFVRPYRATAGQIGTWRITYLSDTRLPAGAKLLLRRCYSSLLQFAWQASDPEADNYVSAVGPEGVVLETRAAGAELAVAVAAGTITAGGEITIILGAGRGIRVWPVAHDLRFVLEITPTGREHNVTIPVRPAKATKFLVKAPSVAVAGDDTGVLVRAVDEFGNTVSDFRGVATVTSEVEGNRHEEISFSPADRGRKLVPSEVPAHIGKAPIRITVKNRSQRLTGVANPTEISNDASCERIFWGDLHCHSNLAQALEPPEFLYRYARDEEALDFICHTEHDAGTEDRWIGPRWRQWRPPVASLPEYVEATWEYRKQLVRKYNEPGRFVTLLGYEWASNLYGHMNVYYASDDAPIFYPEHFWQEDFTPAVLWERLDEIEAFTVPHHVSHRIRSQPGGFVSGWDWNYYDRARVPLVEIYSKHGNSEYFGCPRAIGDQVPEGCVQAALARGYRVGFISDTDTHASRPGSDLAGDLWVRQGGITAVFARSLDRCSLFEALRRRRCYGTSGRRIIVRFWVNDAFMGEEIGLEHPGEKKLVRFQVEGTADLAQVAVVRDNSVIYETSADGPSLSSEYVDETRTEGTAFYYLRVVQADGEMAWASPIWVSVRVC